MNGKGPRARRLPVAQIVGVIASSAASSAPSAPTHVRVSKAVKGSRVVGPFQSVFSVTNGVDFLRKSARAP
jgi:hypothetical protein